MKKYQWTALMCLALTACGGGGDSGPSDAPAQTPFADLYQWQIPQGAKQDVTDLNIFPFDDGDTVVFDRSSAGVANGTLTRTINLFPNATSSIYNVTEIDSTKPGEPDVTKYSATTIQGIGFQADVVDPLGAGGVLPDVYNRIPVLTEYVNPLYPAGSTRSLEVQGPIGGDADGDGKTESYRFTYSQTYRGFEPLQVLGSSRQVAHFSNTVSMTVRFSTGKADSTTSSTEETYFAPGIGLVKRESGNTTRDGIVVDPAYSMIARSAVVAGVTYP